MNQKIQHFLNNFFPDLHKSQQPPVDFMDEDEHYEWLHQKLLIFTTSKETQMCALAIQSWCNKNYGIVKAFIQRIIDSGLPIIHQLLSVLANIQLKKNPKMVDEIINILQDSEEKQRLITQLQQNQQSQVNLQVQDSPKVLKAQTEKKDESFFQNILTVLRCKDKKQK